MADAAETAFAKARPEYAKLDAALINVPDDLRTVSGVVQNAIAVAKKLGMSLEAENGDVGAIRPEADGTIQWGGTRISKATHPARWASLVNQGIINDTGVGTPLTAYIKIRSQLLKMQRAAADPALRYAIGQQVEYMNGVIDKTLQPTPRLAAGWARANRLWGRAFALREVSDAITAATKGTPAEAQSAGVSAVPTRIQGASLVAKLNQLADDGTLSKAFTPGEVKNLRASADLLDRSQRTPIGRTQGEGIAIPRSFRHHAVRGKWPIIGAGAGAVIGGLAGGPLGMAEGAGIGSALGLLVKQYGDTALLKIMTSTDGVEALKALEAAKTATQRATALKALATAATASSAASQPKPLKDLKSEADRRRPAPVER